MRDLLNVAILVPEFYNSLTIELIEINPHFINKQKNLKSFNISIKHHKKVEHITKTPSIIIANEFFDAMPIKQYIKSQEFWYESIFIIDPIDGKIKFDKVKLNKELQDYLLKTHLNARDGAVIEESYKSSEIIKFISQHLIAFGGSSLVIDYGYSINPLARTLHQYHSTLQAIKNYHYHPVLETLGEADLSAHVDFYSLKTLIKNMGIVTYQLTTQQNFLIKYGILLRSQILQSKLPPAEEDIIAKQVDRAKYIEIVTKLTINVISSMYLALPRNSTKKDLVEYSDLASLAVGQCYALLPEPQVRISKLQTTEIRKKDKNPAFIQQGAIDKDVAVNIATISPFIARQNNELEHPVIKQEEEATDAGGDLVQSVSAFSPFPVKEQEASEELATELQLDPSPKNMLGKF